MSCTRMRLLLSFHAIHMHLATRYSHAQLTIENLEIGHLRPSDQKWRSCSEPKVQGRLNGELVEKNRQQTTSRTASDVDHGRASIDNRNE